MSCQPSLSKSNVSRGPCPSAHRHAGRRPRCPRTCRRRGCGTANCRARGADTSPARPAGHRAGRQATPSRAGRERSTCCRRRCRGGRRCRSRGRPRSCRRRGRARRLALRRPRTGRSRPACRGCDTGSWCRSRWRRTGRASRPRRSRPTRPRSGSGRCPRRGPTCAVTSTKRPVPVVSEEHAGRPVACVVIGHRRAGLVLAGAEEVRVDTQVRVEEAIAVEVGHRDAGQHALQRRGEREGLVDDREAPAPVVDEQQRLQARGQHQVLVAVVVDVGKQRLRRVVEQAERPSASVASSKVPSPRARSRRLGSPDGWAT